MCAAEEKGGEAICTRDAAMWALTIGFTASALLHALLHTPVAGSGGRFFLVSITPGRLWPCLRVPLVHQ